MIYDKKTFWKSLLAIFITVGLMFATGGAGYVLVVPIMLFAFIQKKPESVLFWTAVSMTVMIGNYRLIPKDWAFMVAYRGVLVLFGVIMLVVLASHRKARSVAPFGLMIPFLGVMIISSGLGWSPLISFLKLFLFFVMYVAFMGVANQVVTQGKSKMAVVRSMILSMAAFLIVGSVVLIPFPGISQLSGEEYELMVKSGAVVKSLFKGITWHSQTLGPVVAFLTVFIFSDWVLCVRRFSWLHAILLGLCPVLLYLTSSRTAMGGAVMGMGFVTLGLMKEKGVGVRWRARVKSIMLLVVGAAMIAVIALPSLRNSATRFALKTTEEVEVSDFSVDQMMSSRQGLIDFAMWNFRRSPLIGNGFQVSYDMQYKKFRSWKDVLSAPIEKGVWTAAVLEEGGVIGMVFFLLFVIGASVKLYLSRSYMALSLLGTLIVLNFGEFTMFSMSGAGGFLWVLVFIGAAFDGLRLREEQERARFGGWYGAPPPPSQMIH